MAVADPAINLIDVHKSFAGQPVLRGVDLAIERGRTTVICGESGQGKSVLLKHILGLMRPDRGRILVEGSDIAVLRGQALKNLRTRFGVLFQGAALFDSLTVFDNIALPLRERLRLSETEVSQRVTAALQQMDLAGSAEKFPAQLSGGMKKRVGLARALQLEPEILLFDEPTTGLDPVKSHEVYQLFFATQKKLGYTSVIVSHDIPKIFNLADKIAILHQGVVRAALTPEELQRSRDPFVREFVLRVMGRAHDYHDELLTTEYKDNEEF